MNLSLGKPLPNEYHSCSVSLPKWEHIIKYEEGNKEILNILQSGYPRFFIHPSIKKLKIYIQDTTHSFLSKESNIIIYIFPTKKIALRCKTFAEKRYFNLNNNNNNNNNNNRIQIKKLAVDDIYILITNNTIISKYIHLYWQHTGEILSSRYAEYIYSFFIKSTIDSNIKLSNRSSDYHIKIKEKLAFMYSTNNIKIKSKDVFLFPSGMAAIFTSYRLIRYLFSNGLNSMFGFPYLDTLKILQSPEWLENKEKMNYLKDNFLLFYPKGNQNDINTLEEKILKLDTCISGIFTEFPTNPLLNISNLISLSKITKKYKIPLIVDDTIGSYNVNVFKNNSADIIVTSLTKIFSGYGNVMAGSIILNPNSTFYSKFYNCLRLFKDEFLFYQDAKILYENSMDLMNRLKIINKNASKLVTKLSMHPFIHKIYYPKYGNNKDIYENYLNTNSISHFQNENSEEEDNLEKDYFGPVFSILFKGGEKTAKVFYDHISLAKGPSLGTNFTLICPYTLLAHYNELKYVEKCGIDRNLIRISVGVEDFDDIWKSFEYSLNKLSFL